MEKEHETWAREAVKLAIKRALLALSCEFALLAREVMA